MIGGRLGRKVRGGELGGGLERSGVAEGQGQKLGAVGRGGVSEGALWGGGGGGVSVGDPESSMMVEWGITIIVYFLYSIG